VTVAADTTLFVCVSCKHDDSQPTRPGRVLYDALVAEMTARGITDIAIQSVECLSVCKRPCTVALAAKGKWTYIVGDLEAGTHLDDILDGATRYAASTNGVVPWRERPLPFRRGVVARVPPLPGTGHDISGN
jgi:predicted metal-binding protein